MKYLNYTYSSTTWTSTLNMAVFYYDFSRKEKEEETGYSHFGARYYDADLLTGWMSVDPMADKYPSLSPYAYCAWNSVRLIDENGDSLSMTADAWMVQSQAFASTLGDNGPFSYNESTQYVEFDESRYDRNKYNDIQKEIIDTYKELILDARFNTHVSVIDNNTKYYVNGEVHTLFIDKAFGVTINHQGRSATIYISKSPSTRDNRGRYIPKAQKEDYQSICILHEARHALNYKRRNFGNESEMDKHYNDVENFERGCRSIFKGRYRSKDINRGVVSKHIQ